MIVKEHPTELAPVGKAALAAEEPQELPSDAPPPYATDPEPSSAGPSSQSPSSPPPEIPPPVTRSNFISIDRQHDGIKANYIIDPSIVIPEALLPPLGLLTFEKRKNLSLIASHSVDAEVTIPQVEIEPGSKVTLYMKTRHHGVRCRIRRPAPSPAFILEVASGNHGATVILPRSFCGPVTAKRTHATVQTSDAISTQLTFFSDVKGENKFFLGDAAEYMEKEGKNWLGDEAIVSSKHGKLVFMYEDEWEAQQLNKGFLASIFGW